jgi:hypothetical protein
VFLFYDLKSVGVVHEKEAGFQHSDLRTISDETDSDRRRGLGHPGVVFLPTGVFRTLGFSAWQLPLFGGAILSSCLLFAVLPLTSLVWTRHNPARYGLASHNLRQHSGLALRAMAGLMPVTVLFPVISLLGSDHQLWLGASILALGFGIGGAVVMRSIRHVEPIAQAPLSVGALWAMSGSCLPASASPSCSNRFRHWSRE